MSFVVRNKAVILSWAGGGQSSSPPVQLWSDEEEEEEEGILLFVAIKYKKKNQANGEASDEEDDEEEDVNNNSDRLTDSGIGEDREKSEDGDEKDDEARKYLARKEVADQDRDEGNLEGSEGGLKDDTGDEGKEGTVGFTNEKTENSDGSKNETTASASNENHEISKGDEGSAGANSPNLDNEDREDDHGSDLLQDEKHEKEDEENPLMTNLADVVDNVKREAKSMENEGIVKMEEDLIKDRKNKERIENEEDGDRNDVEEEKSGPTLEDKDLGEDECDIKVVNWSKTERESSCSKRVTWKADGGLEERLGGNEKVTRKKGGDTRSRGMEARGRGRGRGRGGVREVSRGNDESVASERPSGVEIGRAWERSLRLATGVRQSPAGQRQLRGIGLPSSQGEGKRHGGGGRGELEDGKEIAEGDWEEDGGGAGWRSLRRLRSKPHRPTSGR